MVGVIANNQKHIVGGLERVNINRETKSIVNRYELYNVYI